MNKLLTSNEAKYRLARTIIQGMIGVIVANLDYLVEILPVPSVPIEIKAIIVALVMAVLSPIMAEIGIRIPEKKEDRMTTRNEVVNIAKKYVGCKQGSDKHKKLVDTFNRVRPHGEKGNYTCAWCAIAWSAFQILAGNTSKTVPLSYNCGTLISDARKLGVWVENDAYVPSPGDGIIYYWSDSGKGDCMNGASHVGTVEKVKGNEITIIEGNKSTSKACGRRVIKVNSRYIRGFIVPKYNGSGSTPAPESKPAQSSKPKASATPSFTKGKTYTVQVDDLNVRTGPGAKYARKAKKDLTKDGQKNSDAEGQLRKGTKVTCQDVDENNGNVWMKIPSGWICAYYQGKKYVK